MRFFWKANSNYMLGGAAITATVAFLYFEGRKAIRTGKVWYVGKENTPDFHHRWCVIKWYDEKVASNYLKQNS